MGVWFLLELCLIALVVLPVAAWVDRRYPALLTRAAERLERS